MVHYSIFTSLGKSNQYRNVKRRKIMKKVPQDTENSPPWRKVVVLPGFGFTQPTFSFLIYLQSCSSNSHLKLEQTKTKGKRKPRKMSWQTYVDDHLMCEIDGLHLTAAAIIGQDGTVWAQSANFPQVGSFSCLSTCTLPRS